MTPLRSPWPALLVCALFGCAGAPPADGAIRLLVTYSGFQPGCIQVTAQDLETPAHRQTLDLPVEEGGEGSVVVAVFRPAGWSTSLQLLATGHERACSGPAVATVRSEGLRFTPRAYTSVTLALFAVDADGDRYVASASGGTDCDDGAPSTHPGAPEQCNGQDDTCDGQIDEGCPCQSGSAQACYSGPRAALGVGVCRGGTQSCVDAGWTPCVGEVLPSPEACDGEDDDCDGVADEGVPAQPCYPFDAGTPGVGACRTGTRACSAGTYGACVGAAGPAAESCDNVDNDCDGVVDGFDRSCYPFDAGTPGAGTCVAGVQACSGGAFSACSGAVGPTPERCDNADNNCNGAVDEGTGRGLACPPQLGCAAVYACESDGGVRCVQTQVGTDWFRDLDGDGRGNPDAGVLACGNPGDGYAANKTDCDDGDALTYPGAPEVCDDKDNNCDGVNVDAQNGSGICPNNSSWVRRSDTGTGDWAAITSPRAGDALLVGPGNRVGLRYGGVSFLLTNMACSSAGVDFSAAEALEGTNQFYLGDSSGGLYHGLVSPSGSCDPSTQSVPGGRIVGLAAFGPPATVTVMGAASAGQPFRWRPPNTVQLYPPLLNATLEDLDGAGPDDVLVVGLKGGAPFAAHFDGMGWKEQTLPPNLPSGSLRSVSVVSDRLAFAAGEAGMVLKLQDGAWSQLPAPAPAPNFTAVLAFGSSAVYTADVGGLRRLELSGWRTLVPPLAGGAVLGDLAGTSPVDLWGAGTQGAVLHWHE